MALPCEFGRIEKSSSHSAKDKMSAQKLSIIDYREANAANLLLPQPAIFSSTGWSHLHLEVFQQPRFDIAAPNQNCSLLQVDYLSQR
jgi:hypothetical protein